MKTSKRTLLPPHFFRLGLFGPKSKLHDQYEQTRFLFGINRYGQASGRASHHKNFYEHEQLCNRKSGHQPTIQAPTRAIGPEAPNLFGNGNFMSKHVAEIAEGLQSLDEEVRRKSFSDGYCIPYHPWDYLPYMGPMSTPPEVFSYSVSKIAIKEMHFPNHRFWLK